MAECCKRNEGVAGTSKGTNISSCCVGKLLNDTCHKTYYVRTTGIKDVCKLTDEERELLYLRLNGTFNTICLHHEEVYIHKYTYLFGRACCNPYEKHKSRMVKSLHVISVDTAKASKGKLLPGKKICPKCESMIMHETSEATKDTEFEDLGSDSKKLNRSLCELGESPVKKISKLSYTQRKRYGKRKLEKIVTSTKQSLAAALHVEPTEINEPINKEGKNNDQNEFCCLIEEMKVKFSESISYAEKIQILTLVPNSWSLEKTCSEFSTTRYTAKKARNIKIKHGILGKPTSRQGKRISNETSHIVQNFYETDDISRICSGKKDYISVRIDDGKIQKQKRLILCNLKEAYEQFKQQHEDIKIGFSKFLGLVMNISDDKKDIYVKFMNPHGPSLHFTWPVTDDICWVPSGNMLMRIPAPSTATGRSYRIDLQTLNQIQEAFEREIQ